MENTYSDLRTSVTTTGIQSNSVTTSRSIDFDFSSVGLEVLGSIFSRDTTLDGETSSVDVFLSET